MSLEENLPGALLILAIMFFVAIGFGVDRLVSRRTDWGVFFSPTVVKIAVVVLVVVLLFSCGLMLYAGLQQSN